MYIVGIDIAKKSHQAVIMNQKGSLVGKSFRFANTKEGFEFLLQKLAEVDSDIKHFEFGMEATGHYWHNLYSWLAETGAILHVINPLQSDALRNLYIRKTKTDKVDAKIIAQVIRIGQYSETQLLDENMLSLRDLCRQRLYFVDVAANLKRKAIVTLDRIFPEYQGFFSDTFGKSSLAVLKNCASPAEIIALGVDGLSNILRQASRGKFGRAKAMELMALAENSFAMRISPKTGSFLVKQTVSEIEVTEENIAETEQYIIEIFEKFNTKITQIPGIGVVLAATILSEIGDINRFATPKKLAAYAGIDPSVVQSGEFTGTKSHMSKRGSYFLRRALWVAAFVGVNHCSEMKELFKAKTAAGKTRFQAMGFVCHRILNAVYAIMKSGKDYSPSTASRSCPSPKLPSLAKKALTAY